MSDYQEWYEMLRDAISTHLNPQDGDEAEVDILCRAVEAAGEEIKRSRVLLTAHVLSDPAYRLDKPGQ